jgi:hypothetical protein
MRLRQPGNADHAIDTLTAVMNQLYDCRSGRATEVQDKWLRWWEMADAQLRNLFTDNDPIISLYQTRLEITRTGSDIRFVQRETNVWIARFEEMISNLKALKHKGPGIPLDEPNCYSSLMDKEHLGLLQPVPAVEGRTLDQSTAERSEVTPLPEGPRHQASEPSTCPSVQPGVGMRWHRHPTKAGPNQTQPDSIWTAP